MVHSSVSERSLILTPEAGQNEKLITADFTGLGTEYFKIWIVNVLLSIVTLGIYSAWATVRNRKYIYGNTWLDDHNFDFHGNPKSILVGRMIAIVLLALYLFGAHLDISIPIIVLGAVLLILPFLVVRSLRFRLRNTSYRNLRFDFTGTANQAFIAFSPAYILAVGYICFSVFSLTFVSPEQINFENFDIKIRALGISALVCLLIGVIVYPVFVAWRSRYFYNHIRYGNYLLSSAPKTVKIYKMYFFTALFSIAIFFCMSLFVGVFTAAFLAADNSAGTILVTIISYLGFALAMLVIHAFWKTRLVNHIFESSNWGGHEFKMQWRTGEYWSVIAGNFLLTVFTLGLGYPWAAVRLAKYKAENFAIRAENFDNLIGTPTGAASAIGDEMTDAFDFEFGI